MTSKATPTHLIALAGMAGKARETAPVTSAGRQRFYVTRESQNTVSKKMAENLSYVGMRNLADLDRIDEENILSASGTIRGRKNRVRAGLANFENPKALEKLNMERGKVVVYATSFRGVRATFEECRYVQDLLHNLRIRVTTKDIYVYQYYHKELEERLRHGHRGHISVPQVFIGGQHIGGKRELEELNEVGELRKILEDYPRYETANNCQICGGFEFIPCRKCGGSKNSTANKFTSEFRALRCTHCNVNGMEECPACVEKRKELEAELREKEMLATDRPVPSSTVKDECKREQVVTNDHQEKKREREERGEKLTCQETEDNGRDKQMCEELGNEVGDKELGNKIGDVGHGDREPGDGEPGNEVSDGELENEVGHGDREPWIEVGDVELGNEVCDRELGNEVGEVQSGRELEGHVGTETAITEREVANEELTGKEIDEKTGLVESEENDAEDNSTEALKKFISELGDIQF